MNVRVIGSTKPEYQLPVEEALMFAGHEAGICYEENGDYDALLNEPAENTMRRVKGTVGSGHHSVSGHPSYNLLLEGVPKIIAMLLNNEKDYNTSEKSARYTHMQTTADEQVIYDRWIDIFKGIIMQEYPIEKFPKITEKMARKLAQENARYFISVFTPATTMGYTVDLRQGNYLIGYCDKLCAEAETSSDPFMQKLIPWVKELRGLLYQTFNVEGLRDNKGRGFSLFAKRHRRESVDENYCVNYQRTFSMLAQAQRHRSIDYEMTIPNLDTCKFYVPLIIRSKDELVAEYLRDMETLKANFPQGILIDINERAPIEKFELKCHERLCGAAQLEICLQSQDTLHKLISGAIEGGYTEVARELMAFDNKTKCQFGFYHCDRPCPLGQQNAFTRLV